MKEILNKFLLWLFNKIKSICIKRKLISFDISEIHIKLHDIITLTVDCQYPVHDNDLDKVKSHATHRVLTGIKNMLNEEYIKIDYSPKDLDNNFLLTTTAKLKVLKRNNK